MLIAIGNVANLIVGRAIERESEISMRAALGASRWRILRQLGTESLLLVLGGGMLGTLVASWGVGIARGWLPADFPRADQIGLDARVLVFTIAACAFVGLVFSVAPAVSLGSRLDSSLRHNVQRLGSARRRLQQSIVVAEVGLSFALLVGGALLTQSLRHLTAVELGLRVEGVLSVPVTPTTGYESPVSGGIDEAEQQALFDAFAEELGTHRSRLRSFRNAVESRVRALPGVDGVAAVGHGAPFSGTHTMAGYRIGDRTEQTIVENRSVSANYFDILGVPIVSGRPFSVAEADGLSGAVIVNRAFAERFWPGEDPAGRYLSGPESSRIVGVVENVREFGFAEGDVPILYLPISTVLGDLPTFLVRTDGNPVSMSETVREAIREVDDTVIIGPVAPLERLLSETYVTERQRTWLLGGFAMSAAVLALVGLYGVISRFVTYQRHELSVRAALGAGAPVLLRMVLGHGALLALVGIGVGAAVALASTQLISGFLFGIDPVDAATYVVIAAGVVAVAFAASYLPARRAARSDPMAALRTE